MRRRTLRFKVGLYLSLALSGVMILFTLLVAWYQRNELLGSVGDQVTQLSEVITRSTRFAMLQDQPAYVDTIISDVADEPGIDKIRIFSRDGRITHSTDIPEIGQTVDRNAEACSHCHQTQKPLEELPKGQRTWTYTRPDGTRLLASMEVIRNEPSCYNAACHHHSKDTSVLGVVNILYSVDEIDQRIRRNALTIAALSLGFVIAASLLVSLFVHRLVYVPLRDLSTGAKRVSAGNLEQQIPVRGGDEFGELADTFNTMTVALQHSQAELRESAQALERKVEERTEELRVAQAEAVRGEKLASVGLLASGIAHELNNPLTGVLTFSHLLRQKMPDGSQDAEDLDIVIRETKRCASIIRRLLDFARDKPPEKKFADLNQIVEDTVRIVERPAHLHDITITTELDRALPQVWVDPNQIKQVVMNLLVNAQHAIDENGSIIIRTRRLPPPEAPQPGALAVPMVEFSITDTGCGIPEENLKRIFDPFFTTKVGKGTGLGLSVSHGIVEAHGGTIAVESVVGKGSTFRVTLPLLKSPEVVENRSDGSHA
jgi:two-component system NtrC family sensor kinase